MNKRRGLAAALLAALAVTACGGSSDGDQENDPRVLAGFICHQLEEGQSEASLVQWLTQRDGVDLDATLDEVENRCPELLN